MLRLSTVLSGSTASAPVADPPNVDARVGDGCAYSEWAVEAVLAVLARRPEAPVVGAVKGGGAGCVMGMVLVSRRGCAGALVVVAIIGGGEAWQGEGRRLAGLREVVAAGWRGEGVAAAVETVVEGARAGSCEEGALRWIEGLLACDRMRLTALSIRKSRRAQELSVCV